MLFVILVLICAIALVVKPIHQFKERKKSVANLPAPPSKAGSNLHRYYRYLYASDRDHVEYLRIWHEIPFRMETTFKVWIGLRLNVFAMDKNDLKVMLHCLDKPEAIYKMSPEIFHPGIFVTNGMILLFFGLTKRKGSA